MNTSIRENSSSYFSSVPPLESGDVLDADEYWRRYEATPAELKAERINNRVFIMSPLRAVHHGNPHALLSLWLGTYALEFPSLTVSDNATIRLDAKNDPQPDLCMIRHGGQTHYDENGYLVGPPEMIVEIAGSSASYDFGEKRDVFNAAGVAEYLVYETVGGRIAWWTRQNGSLCEISPNHGVYHSHLFTGLWLDSDALRSSDAPKLIATLRRGLKSS